MDVCRIPLNVLAKVDFTTPKRLKSEMVCYGWRRCPEPAALLGQEPCFGFLSQPSLAISFSRKKAWPIESVAGESSGLDPSPINETNGGTRLLKTIRNIQSNLGEKIQRLRKNLPLKLLFFLVGFYCATAFATVIGQTGDWDILSAALAVAIVEGIGALMYKGSLPLMSSIRSLITMFNYWKVGLSLGLFLDSFKYEMDNFHGSINPFDFNLDLLSGFL